MRARLNIVISGGTGAGKTTLLNALSAAVPDGERIITVEDNAELRLQQPHVVTLEARPANVEGRGEVTIRDLVRNSLRMRPDRIIVGEVRGAETVDMLQALNTGHEGSLVTLHANSCDDAIHRLATLASMSELQIPFEALRDQINSAIDVIVQVDRYADGGRRVSELAVVASQAARDVPAGLGDGVRQRPDRARPPGDRARRAPPAAGRDRAPADAGGRARAGGVRRRRTPTAAGRGASGRRVNSAGATRLLLLLASGVLGLLGLLAAAGRHEPARRAGRARARRRAAKAAGAASCARSTRACGGRRAASGWAPGSPARA